MRPEKPFSWYVPSKHKVLVRAVSSSDEPLTCGQESQQWSDVVVQQFAPAVLAEEANAATGSALLEDHETSPRQGSDALLL